PGLRQREQSRLIGLLGVEQAEIIYVAELHALACDVETARRRALGRHRLLQRNRIGLNGAQRVGDVLERDDHRAAVLRLRLLERRLRRLLAEEQRAAVEDRLGDTAGDDP